jgi:hypothetical protein
MEWEGVRTLFSSLVVILLLGQRSEAKSKNFQNNRFFENHVRSHIFRPLHLGRLSRVWLLKHNSIPEMAPPDLSWVVGTLGYFISSYANELACQFRNIGLLKEPGSRLFKKEVYIPTSW